jgi:hypothetical protein
MDGWEMTRLERLIRIASTGNTPDVTVDRADLHRLLKIAEKPRAFVIGDDVFDLWDEVPTQKPDAVAESGWRVIHCGVAMPVIVRRCDGWWECNGHYAGSPYVAAMLWASKRGWSGVEIVAPGNLSRDEAVQRAVAETRKECGR